MSHEEQAKLRTQAIRDVTKFSHPTFSKRFKAMAQRGALSKPHRHMMNDTRGEAGCHALLVMQLLRALCSEEVNSLVYPISLSQRGHYVHVAFQYCWSGVG